jgi:hypothetical protein
VATANSVDTPERPADAALTDEGPRRWLGLDTDRWILLAAVVVPVVTALLLTPWRASLDTADNALFLVVAIVAVASTGRRLAAAVAAIVSALSFDYFLTRPYLSFRIERRTDLITEILLLVVGLIVGELAARGRTHRDAAWQGHHQLALLHSVTELAASGQDPQVVVAAAIEDLRELLFLRDCSFTSHDPGGVTARVLPTGEVAVGRDVWSTGDLGLPTHCVDLPVRGGGWLLGHFLLTPTPGKPVPHGRLLVAVTVADQVGAALAADDSSRQPAAADGPSTGSRAADPTR